MDNNFETKLEELETITKELEKGELDLNTSIEKFENGINLIKQLNKILDDAQKKITVLINDENEIVEKDFEIE